MPNTPTITWSHLVIGISASESFFISNVVRFCSPQLFSGKVQRSLFLLHQNFVREIFFHFLITECIGITEHQKRLKITWKGKSFTMAYSTVQTNNALTLV